LQAFRRAPRRPQESSSGPRSRDVRRNVSAHHHDGDNGERDADGSDAADDASGALVHHSYSSAERRDTARNDHAVETSAPHPVSANAGAAADPAAAAAAPAAVFPLSGEGSGRLVPLHDGSPEAVVHLYLRRTENRRTHVY